MSINILRAHGAAQKLAGNPDFVEFCDGLGEVASAIVHSAMESSPEMRVDSSAYARGVADIWRAVEAARTGTNQRQIKAPKLDAKVLASAG